MLIHSRPEPSINTTKRRVIATAWSPSKCTREQIDLWEHAALLYHGYEWQAAAEAFESLAQGLDFPEDSTRCLINASMIRARLGDYNEAAVILDTATGLEQSFGITPFLMGLVEYEIGNIIKAEACFEVCLRAMHGNDVDYSEQGLRYTLKVASVYHNITQVRTNHGQAPDALRHRPIGISADLIFEAPPRQTSISTPIGSDRLSTSEVVRLARSASRRNVALTMSLRRLRTTLLSPSKFLHNLPVLGVAETSTCDVEEDYSFHQEKLIRPPLHDELDKDPLPLNTDQQPPSYNAWKGRRRTPYVPRDARIQYQSTGELARFIRQRQHQAFPLSPRDARVNPESTRELARYIRTKGHESAAPLPTPRLPCDDSRPGSILPHSVTSRGQPRGIMPRRMSSSNVFRHSTLIKDTRGQALLRRHSSPDSEHAPLLSYDSNSTGGTSTDRSSRTTDNLPSDHSLSTDGRPAGVESALEILPATTYAPDIAMSQKSKLRQSFSSHGTVVDRDSQQHDTQQATGHPYANLHTAASSTSSLFNGSITTLERGERARQEALRVLEGRGRPSGSRVAVLERVEKLGTRRAAKPSSPFFLGGTGLGGNREETTDSPSTIASSEIFGLGNA